MKHAAALSVLMMLAGAARAQPPAPPTPPAPIVPPTSRVLNCTTNGCHSKQTDHLFLHGPVAVQACDACHEYKDASSHTFGLKRQGKDLCAFCHIDKTGIEGPVVHEPVTKGECLACHDPHGAQSRRMLKTATTPPLCIQCHQAAMKGAHPHAPAAADCSTCHKAHASSHPHLLISEQRQLCVSCHQDVGKTAAGAAHKHTPAEGDCLQCHAPHASDHIKALKQPPADLCISCHQDVGKAAAAAGHPHSAVTDARSCLNCHAAHGSEHANLLPKDTIGTCLVCHDKPQKAGGVRTVAAVLELAEPSFHKHGPIAKGDCSGCHSSHGGEHATLLAKPYAPGFYRAFSEDAYALCFTCHDKSLATTPTATKETGFRDGARNLHYVHVSQSPQGRSCRACHTVHASRHEQQIADTVTFGEWKLPLNFTPTQGGGSCSPGCHKAESYDRTTPVKPLPSGVPPPAVAPPPSK